MRSTNSSELSRFVSRLKAARSKEKRCGGLSGRSNSMVTMPGPEGDDSTEPWARPNKRDVKILRNKRHPSVQKWTAGKAESGHFAQVIRLYRRTEPASVRHRTNVERSLRSGQPPRARSGVCGICPTWTPDIVHFFGADGIFIMDCAATTRAGRPDRASGSRSWTGSLVNRRRTE